MDVRFTAEGAFLPEIGLWLDASELRAANWISNGHTLDTAPLQFERPIEWSGARLTALPAGYSPGAAQLLIEHGNQRLLYTGAVKLSPPICGEPAQAVACDHLIVESTYGLPIFHFLTRERAAERIISFAKECFAEDVIPVFSSEPLGRGAEIVWTLRQAGLPVLVHQAIVPNLGTYAEAGYRSDGWEPYESLPQPATALVLTPGARRKLPPGRRTRVALVSGWAAVSSTRTRAGAEYLIPYSGHADFEELFQLVERSGARRVDVVGGYAKAFARILRHRGWDAHAAG